MIFLWVALIGILAAMLAEFPTRRSVKLGKGGDYVASDRCTTVEGGDLPHALGSGGAGIRPGSRPREPKERRLARWAGPGTSSIRRGEMAR